MFLRGSCCGRAEEPVSYSIELSKHARDLARVTARLRARKADFTESVRAGELMGEAVTEEASDWLKRGDMVEEKARTLLEEYGNDVTCLCAPSCGSSYTRRRRAVDEVISLAKRLCDEATTIPPTKTAPPAVVKIPMASSIRGMERYISRILCDDGVGIVGVWGAPGVGKTALLSCINNQYFLDNVGFDYVIWAVASSVENLQKNIAARLQLRHLPETSALAIFETLKEKRFLLLLDDVWEAVDLAAVGIPQPTRGQKVVFATRSEYLCRAMDANLSIKMEGLAPEDAWSLFEEKVGRLDGEGVDVVDVPVIRKLAKETVEGCQGLPLALVTVGRAMAVQGSSLASWERARELLRQRPSAIPGMEEHFFPSIKLRYDMLPSDTVRNCFLYCSLWPANCTIDRQELIESWMGLGLMNEISTDINQANDFGHFVIERLKSECMLEAVAGGGGVEMSSVMRGFAHWVASDCGEDHTRWFLRSGPMKDLEEWRSAEHISLTHSQMQVLPSLQAPLVCLNLTTLVLRGKRALNSIPNRFFEGMPGLQYLDLSDTGIEELPKEIGILSELIYLNLSHTYITSLPKEMEKLAKLKYLCLQRTMHLTTVPGGLLSSLRSLQVLDLTGSGYQFDHLKDSRHGGGEDIKLLGSLRKGMRAIGITVTSVPALRWLSGLSRVPIRQLWIIRLDCLAGQTLQLLSPELLGSSNIRDSLRDLAIKHSKALEVLAMVDGPSTAAAQRRGSDAGSLPRLETLHLVQLTGLKKISWYGSVAALSLPYLRELHISFCPKLKHVTWVLRLPCLEHLSLRGCTQMEAINKEIDQDERVISAKSHLEKDSPAEFPSLKELVMEDLPMMKSIYKKTREQRLAAAFPRIVSFSVSRCPRLTRLPLELGKLQKIKCEKEWWEKLHGEEIRSSLAPCVVYIPVAAPPPPPPPLPPVPPRSLVLLRKGMDTAVLFLGALVFRAFLVSLVFVLIKASPPDFLFFFSIAVSLAGWVATRWPWLKKKITRVGFQI